MKRRRNQKTRRGGNYTSGTTYAESVVGDGPSQFSRALQHPGMQLWGTQGQHVGGSKKRKKGKTKGRTKRGGFWGHMINQAVVPLSILGMQQSYRGKTRKRRGKR